MGRRASPGKLPSWYKGRMLNESRGDFWYGEREGKLSKQEGKLVDKQMRDSVTDIEREEQIQRRLSR